MNEHNAQLIAAAEWNIDIGPNAGAEGGEVVHAGLPRSTDKLLVETSSKATGSGKFTG